MASKVNSKTSQEEGTGVVVPIEEKGTTDITILDCMIETVLLTVGAVPNIRNLNFEATKSKFRKIFPWEKDFEIRKAGSTVDLLYITKFCMGGGNLENSGIDFNTDLDVLFIPKSVNVCNADSEDPNFLAIIEPTDYPGFVTLKYSQNCQYKVPESILTKGEGSHDVYISSQKLLKIMLGYMNVKQHAADIVGPSIQLLSSVMRVPRSFLTSADIVLALRNPEWPESASEWLIRERPNNWPTADVVEEIHQMGSHVVAKGNQLTPEVDTTWRLSFNMAERRIAEIMSFKQRQCFLLVKALIKESKVASVSSYHIKTVLWWLLEQGEKNMWTEKSVGECFLILLEELAKSLKQHHIKNYFLPENNMISHISKDECEKLAMKLEEICEKPVSAILNSRGLTENSIEIFSICPVEEYHFENLKQALLKFDGEKKTKEELLGFFKFHFLHLGSCFLVDPNQREKGIALLKKVSILLDPQADPVQFVKKELLSDVTSALQKQNLEVGLGYFAALLTIISDEEVVEAFSEEGYSIEMLASLFHDTGCVFSLWASKGFWKQQRTDDLKSSEKCFLTSISLNPSGPENNAEFAHFLLFHDRYTEAVKYGETAIKNCKQTNEFRCLSFSMEDRDILDISIARHVQYENGLIVPAVVIAYYVIVRANKLLEKLDEAKTVLPDYLTVCEDTRHKSQFEALSLYGYSCMSLGLYKKAKHAFIKADKIKRSHVTDDNLDICNKVLAASGTEG